jgi:hypothetical protein
MTTYVNGRRIYKETEYKFSGEDDQAFPHLSRLLLQGYNFVVLQRCPDPAHPRQLTYLLACEVICSNGTELLHRHEALTPEFGRLSELEHFVRHNMMAVLHRHFFGRDLEVVR